MNLLDDDAQRMAVGTPHAGKESLFASHSSVTYITRRGDEQRAVTVRVPFNCVAG